MSLITLAALIVAVAAAASTGTMYKPGPWYDGLVKPAWTPPKWAFPVAWILLYAAMAWAAWRVSMVEIALAGPTVVGPALAVFAAQIVLNAIWTPCFFGAHRIGAALAIIVALWVAVLAMAALFFRADLLAGALVLPYLGWISYAAALNAWIWRNNRGQGVRAED